MPNKELQAALSAVTYPIYCLSELSPCDYFDCHNRSKCNDPDAPWQKWREVAKIPDCEAAKWFEIGMIRGRIDLLIELELEGKLGELSEINLSPWDPEEY